MNRKLRLRGNTQSRIFLNCRGSVSCIFCTLPHHALVFLLDSQRVFLIFLRDDGLGKDEGFPMIRRVMSFDAVS